DGDATNNFGLHDYWVVKVSASGAVEWQISMGGSSNDEANALVETSNGDFVVTGYSASNDFDVTGNRGNNDFWVVKIASPLLNPFYADADSDSYGNPNVMVMAASAPTGYVADMQDCNDSNPNIHPGAIDLCNGIDDNCDGYSDEDGLVASLSPLA